MELLYPKSAYKQSRMRCKEAENQHINKTTCCTHGNKKMKEVRLIIFTEFSSLYKKTVNTFDVRVVPVMLIKFAPASVASALARRVLPVPGGPNSRIPLQG